MNKSVAINKNVHEKLSELSNKRKKDINPAYSMMAILHELILKEHKKEFGK